MRGDPELRIRISPDLEEWLEKQAKANHRSKTAEASFRLEEARRAMKTAAGTASQA